MLFAALGLQCGLAFAESPKITGAWTGAVHQNSGASNYTVIMTITSTGAETDYLELKCGGSLKRVAATKGYVFFTETITRGGKSSGGSCIDGTVTVIATGANLSWGWVGSDAGQVLVAWSNLAANRVEPCDNPGLTTHRWRF